MTTKQAGQSQLANCWLFTAAGMTPPLVPVLPHSTTALKLLSELLQCSYTPTPLAMHNYYFQ